MIKKDKPAEEIEFFNLSLAKWVVNVLGMLIAVVGEETLLGLILRQTRSEITSLVRDEEKLPAWPRDQWYHNN